MFKYCWAFNKISHTFTIQDFIVEKKINALCLNKLNVFEHFWEQEMP